MIKKSDFKPAWWLPGPHLQTIWPTCFKRIPQIETSRERFLLEDGDFLDLDWAGDGQGPIVCIFHGLGGSINSNYAKSILKVIVEQGWRGVFVHFRGCSGEPNRFPCSYHMGSTEDVHAIVHCIKCRYPRTQIAAIGFSLGGNVLLKWLGQTAEHNPLSAAVAVSVPFDIQKAIKRFDKGFSKFYQWFLLKTLRECTAQKMDVMNLPIDKKTLAELRTFRDFDNKVTAPLHGFVDADDYYRKTSCHQYLKNVKIPTLVIHALDDPFMTEQVIAGLKDLSSYLTLELSKNGGHVGFISGDFPWRPTYWLEKRIPEYLHQILATTSRKSANEAVTVSTHRSVAER